MKIQILSTGCAARGVTVFERVRMARFALATQVGGDAPPLVRAMRSVD